MTFLLWPTPLGACTRGAPVTAASLARAGSWHSTEKRRKRSSGEKEGEWREGKGEREREREREKGREREREIGKAGCA